MINKENIKGFILGATAAAMLCSTAAFAQNIEKTVNAVYNNIKLVVNGSEVTPKDVDGNTVEPFIIDGTTYLPVRAVANALGQDVDWDGNTYTVYIGEKPKTEDKAFTADKTIMEQFKNETLANVGKQAVSGALYNYTITDECNNGTLKTYADNYREDGNLQTLTIQGTPAAEAFATSVSSQFSQIYALCSAATDSSFKTDDAALEEAWSGFRSNFETDDEYTKFLSDYCTTDEAMKELIKSSTIANQYAEQLYNNENEKTYTSDELYKAYTDNYVHAKHILVKDEATANDVIAQLKKGKAFDDAVKEFGTDPGQPEEGYTFTKGEMVKEFEDAAFALKTNTYTATPVKTSYGYHIIYRYPIAKADVEADSEQIKTTIAGSKYSAALKEIFEKYTISYTDKYNEYVKTIK